MLDSTHGSIALLLCLSEDALRAQRIADALADRPEPARDATLYWTLQHCDSIDALLAALPDGDAILVDLRDPLPVLQQLTGTELPCIVVAQDESPSSLRALIDAGADEYLPDSMLTPLLLERTLRLRDRNRAVQARSDYLAQFDVLTGLPNGKQFERQLEHALHGAERHDRRLGIVSLVLDDFPKLAARLGQEGTEALLLVIAERLSGCLRRSDLVARAHHEEFLLMLECGNDLADVAFTADKLLQVIHAPLDERVALPAITASMGVAVFPLAGTSPSELLREARAARAEVVREGGGDFRFYDAELEVVSRQSVLIEEALQGAAERGELSLRFQPRIDLVSGAISGAEVLLRWDSPRFGPVSPERFIPLAEASGAIGRIGAWVLAHALTQARHWLDAGLEVRLGVNISAGEFGGEDFSDRVARALDRAGVPASVLELELTERVFVANVAGHRQLFDDLNALGVGLAVDDFGIGYSSLSYLKHFPVHALKIDQSFVDALPGAADDAAIVRAVIALGHALDLRVVAEGVENDAQLRFLRDAGCDEVQGYLFGSPCGAADFTERLQRGVLPDA